MPTFDIHIEGVPYLLIRGGRGLTFGDYQTVVGVAGVQKMVDRFVKCFFTPLGSDLTDREYGSTVMAHFGNTLPSALEPLVYSSVQQCVDTLQRYDDLYFTEDDERISGASVESYQEDPAGDGFLVKVRLTNAAGTTVSILVSDAMKA